jgi:hypothetical protein
MAHTTLFLIDNGGRSARSTAMAIEARNPSDKIVEGEEAGRQNA